MPSFLSPALPETFEFAAWRTRRITDFCQRWQRHPTLDPLDDENDPIERWCAVTYIDYEALYDQFCQDAQDFCRLAALMLGECLVHHLGMRWCRSPLFAGEDLLVHHPDYPKLIRNLYARVVHQWLNHSSYALSDLLTHIIVEWRYHLAYPLDEVLGLSWHEAEPLYLRRWGKVPPQGLHRRLQRIFEINDETAVRYIGDIAFRLPITGPGQRDWLGVEYAIKACEEYFEQQAQNWHGTDTDSL